jgi:ribonuclease HI
METIDIFTDGSTLNNQQAGKRAGGAGVFFGDDDPRNISMPMKESKKNKVTNQVAELTACIKAIENAYSTGDLGSKKINIYTDSMYIVNSIASWAKNWEKNDWRKSDNKPIKNLHLIKKLYYYSRNFQVIFKHVKAHKKKPSNEDSEKYRLWYGNFMADKLATDASKGI